VNETGSDGQEKEDREDVSDENRMRDEAIQQLRMSLLESWRIMMDGKLDVKSKERWARIHSYTAAVLNDVLRDRQNMDWERRVKELERAGKVRIRRITWKGPPRPRPWILLDPVYPVGKKGRKKTGRRTRRTLQKKKERKR